MTTTTTERPVLAPWLDAARVESLARRAVTSPGTDVPTISPMTGEPCASLPRSTEADVDAAFAAARTAQQRWERTPVEERCAIMLRFHDLCLSRQAEVMDVIQIESGKARRHAFEEIANCAVAGRHLGRTAAHTLRTQRVPGVFPVLSQTRVNRLPKGVVGIVSPWNYPFSLSVGDCLPALVAGNAVVLRPDPQGSLSALIGAELLAEAGLPDGVLQVVLGDGDIGQAVVERGDAVSFTGSTATGRTVATIAGRRLVSCSLELGGKNGLYVRADADVAKAVEGIIRACYSSAGQLCVSIERLLVHRDIADELVPALVDAIGRMRVGNALSFGYDMGSLCGPRQLERVTAHVDDAVAHGATVLAGGHHRPDLGPFVFEPTLLEGVTPQMTVCTQETFGPVVSLVRVDGDDDAVARMNDTEYGLNASIYTRDVTRARELAARIRTGIVNINEGYAAAYVSVAAPMGGMKSSGLGRRHGVEGLLKYTEAQNVTAQHLLGFGPVAGLSDQQYTAVLTGALKALKRLGMP